MTDTLVTELCYSVESLKEKWANLNVVDRADAVKSLHDREDQKVSLPTLAKELGCSLTHVRDLYTAASAPFADRFLARQRKISTRELVRRARDAKAAAEAQRRSSAEAKRTKEAEAASKLIFDWLAEEKKELLGSVGECIISNARHILADAEQKGKLPLVPAPPTEMSAKEVMNRLRPPRLINDEVGSPGWYAQWLARWTFYVFPNPLIRHKALNIALDAQIRYKPDKAPDPDQ